MSIRMIGEKCCHACRHFQQHMTSLAFDCRKNKIFFDYRERGAYYVCDEFSPFTERDFDYGVASKKEQGGEEAPSS